MNTRLRKNLTGSMSFYSHIPALDGGHVFFLLYEMITGRKPGDKFLTYAEYAASPSSCSFSSLPTSMMCCVSSASFKEYTIN